MVSISETALPTVTLLGHSYLKNWRYLLTFKFSAPVSGEYIAKVDNNKTYSCYTLPDQPELLYCHGPLTGIDTTLQFELQKKDNHKSLLEGSFYIPYFLPED